jgi:hypothetical protein
MASQLSGLTTVFIDGNQYDAVGPGSFVLSSVERTAKVAFSGAVFYTETPVAGSIEVSIYVPPGVDPQAFKDMVDVPVVVQLANDLSIVADDAFCSATVEYDAEAGTVKLTFLSGTVQVSVG